MPRVIHFELQSANPDASAEFYQSVFGWGINRTVNKDYWLIHTGVQDQRGINGGMTKTQSGAQAVVLTIDVPSIEDYVAKIMHNGGKVVKKKFALPGTGWVAYCEDPDKHVFALMQYDPAAK